ncbi:MAG: HAD-IA family hydrolase [bacterium]|nr:HAD-IA family hydrolase [bacterium]
MCARSASADRISRSTRGGRVNLLPVDELFGVVINSSEVGIRKSDARIFQFALERLGVSPKEALFLDGYANNIHPAEALGLRGVLARSGSGFWPLCLGYTPLSPQRDPDRLPLNPGPVASDEVPRVLNR